MRIGEIARLTACPIQAIRYYERVGLLPRPLRSSGNFRLYGETHVERLEFIRRCRSLDMSLNEIRILVRHRQAPREDCGEVNHVLDDQIARVAARIQELMALERELRDLREQCSEGRTAANCGILKELAQPMMHATGCAPGVRP